MKNLASIFAFLILFNASSQDVKLTPTPSKFYHKINVGYSFKAGGAYYTQLEQNFTGGNIETRVPFSYGKGFNISYGLGYMFHPNIGVELTASYLIGGVNEGINIYYESNGPNPYTVRQVDDYKSNMFRLSPSFIVAAQGKKISPYCKFGLLVGWGTAREDIDETANFQNGGTPGSGKFVWKYSGFSGVGITSAAGIKIKANPLFDVFIELNQINFSAAPKKASRTTSDINGQSNLSS